MVKRKNKKKKSRLKGRAKATLNLDGDRLDKYFEEEEDFNSLLVNIRNATNNRTKAEKGREWLFKKQSKSVLFPLFSNTTYDSDIAGYFDDLLLKNDHLLPEDKQLTEKERDQRQKKVEKKHDSAREKLDDAGRFKPHKGKAVKYDDAEIEQIRGAIKRGVPWKTARTQYINKRGNAGKPIRTREGYRKKYFRVKRAMKKRGLV